MYKNCTYKVLKESWPKKLLFYKHKLYKHTQDENSPKISIILDFEIKTKRLKFYCLVPIKNSLVIIPIHYTAEIVLNYCVKFKKDF